MVSKQLSLNEYHPYYKSYIDLAPCIDIVQGLQHNLSTMLQFYESIPVEKHNYSYANGKWTIKQVLNHIIDTERIFAYRALRIARNDDTPMPGFDQDRYVENSNILDRTLPSLLYEYKVVRYATIALFESLDNAVLKQVGSASEAFISVRAIGYIIAGHENHHHTIIKECYL